MSSATEAFARAIVRDPTAAEIGHFLSTRTGSQMVHLMRSMREPAAQAALTAALLAAPSAVVSHSAVPEKAKKALNAFVGFRCYYISIPVFKSVPMKLLSHPIGMIWEADPNKSLWSLMAKAWSTIRDQIGKNNAPLADFFGIVCPVLCMPSQERYLELHGWTFTVDKDGAPSLSRDESFRPTPANTQFAHTPLSVEDIIVFAQSKGYATDYVADPNAASPTFLGQSRVQNYQVKRTAQTAANIHNNRVLARNKRRMKRKNVRIIRDIQAQTTTGHFADAELGGYELDLTNSPFIDSFSGLLRQGLLHIDDDDDDEEEEQEEGEEEDDAGLPNISATCRIPAHTQWDAAFLPGADANAILPAFGQDSS